MKTKPLRALILVGLFITGCTSVDKSGLKGAGVMRSNAKPFDGTKVVQIGIVVGDVEKFAKSYAEFFGVEAPKIITSEVEDKAKTRYHGKPTMARVKQAFFHFDDHLSIEILEPVGGPSTWKEFLDNNGEGIHHIAFEIKGMDARIEQMQNRGAPLIQQGQWTGGSGGRYTYFESRPQLAMIIELLENF
jgi:catechol 2,3-dioxygenase-like lactoylglutathione lyase family enzyme